MSPAVEYAVALALTLAVEMPIVVAALRRWYAVGVGRGAALAVLATLLTHPILWFVLEPTLSPALGYLGFVLAGEGFAWVVEGLVFWLVVRRDALSLLLVSLGANLSSYLVGALLMVTGLWPGA